MIAVLLFCLGAVSANPLSRIINGDSTDTITHPWQVSLVANSQGQSWHTCGGSIIHPNYVLTAAHCTGGSLHVETNKGTLGKDVTQYQILKTTNHPMYNRGSGAYPNDIALLQVDGDLTKTGDVISLAPTDIGDFRDAECKITGWGQTEDGSPSQLQETTGTILSHNQCRSHWGSNYVDTAHICIYDNYSGSCNGDSGGPMVCSGWLAGVTSWGANGCSVSYPSVYARVSTYHDWIDGIINQ